MSSIELSALGEAARQLADQGWQVFPLSPRSKVPRKRSSGFKDATDDVAQVESWWLKEPTANIGVSAGDIHEGGSGVWSIDFDTGDDKDGMAVRARLEEEHGPLGGLILRTARGVQHVFSWDERCPRGPASDLEPGVDVRSTGSYFLAPPSIHPSGLEYSWGGGRPDAAPSWLVEWVRDRLASPAPGRPEAATGALAGSPPPAHPEAVPQAGREGFRPYSDEAYREYFSMLGYIDPKGRDDWLRVGFAIWELGWGDRGYELWTTWSRIAIRAHDPADQAQTWKSFGRGYDGPRTTIASVAKAAGEAGWRDPGLQLLLPPGSAQEEPWDLVPALDLAQVAPRREHVGTLIRRGEVGVLYGDSMVGKSFAALSMSIAVAKGEPWFGLETHRPSRVLYVVAEGARGMGVRLRAQLSDWRDLPSNLVFLTRPVNLWSDEEYSRLFRMVSDGGYEFLILDTLARCIAGADENSNSDMGTILDRLGSIARTQDCTVMAIHHKGKSVGRLPSKGMRGASAILAGADFSIEAELDWVTSATGQKMPIVKLSSEKAKEGVAKDDSGLVLERVVVRTDMPNPDRGGAPYSSLRLEPFSPEEHLPHPELSPVQIALHRILSDRLEPSTMAQILPRQKGGDAIPAGPLRGNSRSSCRRALLHMVELGYVISHPKFTASGEERGSRYELSDKPLEWGHGVSDFVAEQSPNVTPIREPDDEAP